MTNNDRFTYSGGDTTPGFIISIEQDIDDFNTHKYKQCLGLKRLLVMPTRGWSLLSLLSLQT